MKKFILTILVFIQFVALASFAGELKYSIADIPDPLKKNANCVVRIYETAFRVDDNHKAQETVLYAITLLNSKAIDEAEMKVFYDDKSTVNYLKFSIYNAIGEDITRSFKTLEVTDESATPEGQLYTDYRCKVVTPVFAQYPITIEYSYEFKSQIISYFPFWMPISATNMSLQQASFTLIAPNSRSPRIRSVNQIPEAIKSSDKQNTRYFWKLTNISAIETEPYSPPFYELVPYLLLAPDNIKYKDYNNSFSTWSDFGKFQSYLNQGRDQLSPETVLMVTDLVKECPDKQSKIKKAYKYMQNHTRYVGVQIGIGGSQPIPAEYVDKKGYGDCKGLVNYTKALLKSIGIESFYTLVNAGNNSAPVIADFPSEQFNHIILCVPDDKDTIWLECTSQRQAFGYLGSFTDNRDAVVVNDNGGTLVKTIAYNTSQNSSTRKMSLIIDESGDASIKSFTENKALQSEVIESIFYDSPEDQRKYFLKYNGYSDCIINSLKYSLTGDFIPIGIEEANLLVSNYASKSGTRLFVPFVTPDRNIVIPQSNTPRVFPIVIRNAFTYCDSIVIKIPVGYKTEFIPGKQFVDSKFGKYTLSVEMIESQLHCYRSFVLFSGKYNAADYFDFVAFLKKVAKYDQSKIVLSQIN